MPDSITGLINTFWSIDLSNNAGDVFTSPIVDKNNIVYIGSGNYVYAIGDTGKMPYYRWAGEKFTIPTENGEIYSACSLDSSGIFLYFGTTKGYIYKINAITGEMVTPGYPIKIAEILSQSNTNEYIIYTPICIVYDNNINNNVAICSATYDNNTQGITVAIDTSNNTLLWQYKNMYTQSVNGLNTPIPNGPLFNGIAYNKFKNSVYISTIRHVVSLDISGGSFRCIFKGNENKPSVCFSSPTVDSSGNLLVSALNNFNSSATLHNKLYSLTEKSDNVITFAINWEENIDDSERLSAAVIDDSSNIWLTSKKNIHKLEFVV